MCNNHMTRYKLSLVWLLFPIIYFITLVHKLRSIQAEMKIKRNKQNETFALLREMIEQIKKTKTKKKEIVILNVKNVNAKCFPYHFKKHMANDCKNKKKKIKKKL